MPVLTALMMVGMFVILAVATWHYQQMLFIIFTLLSAYMVDVEVRTPKGRVDMVLCSDTHLYLFELKLNKSAEATMLQIDLKEYGKRFALCGLPIVEVGINFDMEKHTITDRTVDGNNKFINMVDYK